MYNTVLLDGAQYTQKSSVVISFTRLLTIGRLSFRSLGDGSTTLGQVVPIVKIFHHFLFFKSKIK